MLYMCVIIVLISSEAAYNFHSGDCPGNDIRGQRLRVSLMECNRRCDMRDACAGFVYAGTQTPNCFLKQKKCTRIVRRPHKFFFEKIGRNITKGLCK